MAQTTEELQAEEAQRQRRAAEAGQLFHGVSQNAAYDAAEAGEHDRLQRGVDSELAAVERTAEGTRVGRLTVSRSPHGSHVMLAVALPGGGRRREFLDSAEAFALAVALQETARIVRNGGRP